MGIRLANTLATYYICIYTGTWLHNNFNVMTSIGVGKNFGWMQWYVQFNSKLYLSLYLTRQLQG